MSDDAMLYATALAVASTKANKPTSTDEYVLDQLYEAQEEVRKLKEELDKERNKPLYLLRFLKLIGLKPIQVMDTVVDAMTPPRNVIRFVSESRVFVDNGDPETKEVLELWAYVKKLLKEEETK